MKMSRERKLQLLRILRAARVNEPTVLTSKRAEVYRLALSRDLIVPTGQRRGSVLCRLTKAGELELSVLEKDVGEMQEDFAARAVIRRASGDRGGLAEPGELPEGFEG
jgi:hypothetical protein